MPCLGDLAPEGRSGPLRQLPESDVSPMECPSHDTGDVCHLLHSQLPSDSNGEHSPFLSALHSVGALQAGSSQALRTTPFAWGPSSLIQHSPSGPRLVVSSGLCRPPTPLQASYKHCLNPGNSFLQTWPGAWHLMFSQHWTYWNPVS